VKKIILLIVTLSVFSINAQTTSDEYYKAFIKNNSRTSLTMISNGVSTELNKVQSDGGAYYDRKTQMLVNKNHVSAKLWLNDIPQNPEHYPYRFSIKFSMSDDYKSSTWPLQFMLGNSPSGYAWLGVDITGKLSVSYSDKDGFHDLLNISKADRVYFDKPNVLEFVWFPSGIFYVRLNTYKEWSFEIFDFSKRKLIPYTGLSNRISFGTNVKIHFLDLSYYKGKRESTVFYKNGNLKELGKYKNGSATGKWKFYHENGNLSGVGKYKNGDHTGEWKFYYDNGQLKNIYLRDNGKLMEFISCFNRNGKPLDKGTLLNGNGTVRFYDNSGKFLETKTFLNGKIK